MHDVDAQRVDRRNEDRHDDQQHRTGLEEAAEHEEQYVDDDQELDLREVILAHPGRKHVRDVLAGDDVVEGERASDEYPYGSSGTGTRQKCRVELPEADGAVEHDRDEERISGGYGRRLGRCHDSAVDAAKQDDRQHQGRQRLDCDPRQLGNWHGVVRWEVASTGRDTVHHDEHDGHQQPGQYPGRKQVADRCVGNQCVKHHRNRRRYDRPDRGRRRGQRSGIALRIVTVLGHHVDLDPSHPDRVGDGRA